MAQYHVPPLEELVEKFESLPGIGHKSAQRLAYHVLGMTQEEAQSFAQAILDAHEKIHTCKVCCNLTDDELCPVCRSGSRDKSTICVVEEPKDVFALGSRGGLGLLGRRGSRRLLKDLRFCHSLGRLL